MHARGCVCLLYGGTTTSHYLLPTQPHLAPPPSLAVTSSLDIATWQHSLTNIPTPAPIPLSHTPIHHLHPLSPTIHYHHTSHPLSPPPSTTTIPIHYHHTPLSTTTIPIHHPHPPPTTPSPLSPWPPSRSSPSAPCHYSFAQ